MSGVQQLDRFRLSACEDERRFKVLTDVVSVDAETRTTVVTLLRTGDFWHPVYGDFSVTRELLDGFVRNFNDQTYGQEIFLDRAHNPQEGAAANIIKLFVSENKLRAQVEWTPFGVELVKQKGYKYLSADYTENYIDNEQRKEHGPLLFGGGLVTRPHIKHMDQVQLAECEDVVDQLPVSGRLLRLLNEESHMKWAELLRKLKEKLVAMKLSDAVVDGMVKLAESGIKTLTEQPAVEAVLTEIETTAQALADSGAGDSVVNLSLAGLDEAGVRRILKDERDAADTAVRQLAETLTARQTTLANTINAAKGLDDAAKNTLSESMTPLITAEMSDEQVKKLADYQIAQQLKLVAAHRLAEQGVSVQTPMGSVRLAENARDNGARLQGIQHDMLRRTGAFRNGKIVLAEKVDPFVEDVLNVFDAQNARAIHHAVKTLSDGTTGMSNTDLPIGYQREVIREALQDLNVLQLVATYTDPTATATTSIPYEERNTGGVHSSALTPERQGIQTASVSQKMDLAYIRAMKLAIDVSNEVMHFTQASQINWDAWGRNIASVSLLIRELLCARLANEMQRIADSYLALNVANEDIAPQLDGGTHTIKTALFPVVAQFQERDLKGNSINAVENPITVMIDAAEVPTYDGTNEQAGGTYYSVVNHNLGYIMFVTELGAPVSPNSNNATIAYSYATNVQKFDADVPANVKLGDHLDGLLRAVGSRKAIMLAERYVQPDFQLMSPILNDICSNATQFSAEAARNGSNTNNMGDLATVKGIAAFGTNAPGIHLGDERILMGQRGVMSYTVAKAWSMSEPIEGRDENGVLNGTKQSYGEEYNAIKAPRPLANRFTSVLYYSASNR